MSEHRIAVSKVQRTRSTFEKLERKITLKDAVRELWPDIEKVLESGQVTANAVHEHLEKELGASRETIKSYIQDVRREEDAKRKSEARARRR